MVAEQGRTIAGQQRRSEAAPQPHSCCGEALLRRALGRVTRVFTWSTDRGWENAKSTSATFADGVRFQASNDELLTI